MQNFTSITDPSAAIIGTTRLGSEKTWRPTRRWNLGLDVNKVSNQVRQVKAATLVTTANTSGNQGQSKPVKNLRVTRRSISPTQYKVSISFTPNANDPYFQGVAVSLSQGDGTPLQVATGRQSPVTFITAKTSLPSSVSVQSVGSLGSTSISRSPSRAIKLNQQ